MATLRDWDWSGHFWSLAPLKSPATRSEWAPSGPSGGGGEPGPEGSVEGECWLG